MKDPQPSDDLQSDPVELHRAVLREPPDPDEGREPGPWWLWSMVALTLFGGGFYLGRHSGTFTKDVHIGYVRPSGTGGVPKAAPRTTKGPADFHRLGETVYTQTCAVCHQANGNGLPPAFPPLAGSEWVTGNPDTVVRIILHGVGGPIDVGGTTFNGVMPPWGPSLSDDQVAAVATYVRSTWGNTAGPVTADQVAKLRAEPRAQPWTAEELKAQAGVSP